MTCKPTLGRDDCYSQVLTSAKWAVLHSRPSTYATSTSYIYEIALSAGLNGLQVDQVDRENDE